MQEWQLSTQVSAPTSEHLPLAPSAPQPCSALAAAAVALAFPGQRHHCGKGFLHTVRTSVPLCLFNVKRMVVGQKWGRCFGKGWALLQKRRPERERAEIIAGEKGRQSPNGSDFCPFLFRAHALTRRLPLSRALTLTGKGKIVLPSRLQTGGGSPSCPATPEPREGREAGEGQIQDPGQGRAAAAAAWGGIRLRPAPRCRPAAAAPPATVVGFLRGGFGGCSRRVGC